MTTDAPGRGRALPQRELAAFCRRNRIRKLALFGSILRDDFRPDSDIDVLVEFRRGHPGWAAPNGGTGAGAIGVAEAQGGPPHAGGVESVLS